MPRFTQKERREHYAGVASGTIPTKKESKYSKKEQISYSKGQRDARNEANVAWLLGKNSPLSDSQKQNMRANLKAKRDAFKAKQAKK